MGYGSPCRGSRPAAMPHLELMRTDHASRVLAFEEANRSYFAAWVPDRGDGYFAEFDEQHRLLLASQAAGTDYSYVLVDCDGSIVGRVNLYHVADGVADLGYRIAQRSSRRGLATAAVRMVCAVAVSDYGLTVLHASARAENVASQTVLSRTGFVAIGDVSLSGRPGIRFRRALASRPGADPSRAGGAL